MANPVQLRVIAEKTLYSPANPDLLAYSPSMELLAVGGADHNVLIYRLNGQRVFSLSQKVKDVVLELQKLVWKPNGQLIAIAWSGGTVRLIGAESNKTVHQITVSEEGDTEVTCLAWTSYSAASTSLGDILAEAGPLWKDATRNGLKGKSAQLLDLPRDLAAIDIESSLPKLSVLPSGGTTEDIFSSRASLDALFRPFDPKDNDSISIMVVGTSSGHIHLTIFDSFVIGTFPSPLKSSKTSRHQLIRHASHPHHAVHGFLMKSTSTLVGGLYFVPMHLGFLTSERSDLSLLASRSSALQNLLRYIHQVQTLMAAEYQATQDLPSRFLGNIDETLAEHGDWTIAPALYHQVVTGHTLPEVKEWLVDELAERGHKRWDKALTTAHTTLLKLTHTHLLPALERASLLLSRLHGLASYHHPSTPLGFSPKQIKNLLDTVAALNLVATRVLATTVGEVEGWAAFGGWVRGEIDRLAAGESAAGAGDDKEAATVPTAKILEYIQGSLTASPLAPFFTPLDAGAGESHTAALESTTPLFPIMATALNSPDPTNEFHTALPNIAALTAHLATQAQAVSCGIADAEKRNVRFGDAVEVDVPKEVFGDEGRVDMRMCSGEGGEGVVYIATSASKSPTVSIQRISLPLGEEGSSATTSVKVDVGGAVKDIAFLDEEVLLALIDATEPKDGVYILALPFLPLPYATKPSAVQGRGRRFRVKEGAERVRVGGGRVVVGRGKGGEGFEG
ncbi:hypothetical protein GMDG_03825 [Pseudogymnoascus destructans 20631-21]|uniref:Anaphase-promoting complex subunit 4 n=1 Tax=Pseudogymnoascus destructans (strain ATCC MYA-4855 / 20631-21) TaxID=658429 RepID=L8G7P7_PSED2|nr:hypothetical protein GMDG_03825 [Pseudogymnoascus destructans 20631-21]